MASHQEKDFCALRFEVSRSVITVQREFRARLKKRHYSCVVRLTLLVAVLGHYLSVLESLKHPGLLWEIALGVEGTKLQGLSLPASPCGIRIRPDK
jgi:hypothetical protein